MTASAEIGSLAWGRTSGGQLHAGERRAMRRAVLREAGSFARSRLLVALGRGDRRAQASLEVLDLPDTGLCRAVEAAAAAHQSPTMLGHAYRSVAYAHAVATIDGIEVDAELLWCACLLHDVALEHPVPGRCFAVRGGELAERVALDAGADATTAHQLGDAVCRHATPGLDATAHPLPYLVAGGALVDVLGRRLDELDRRFVAAVQAADPRGDIAAALAAAWRAESRAVPHGRAAVAERTAGLSLAARFAPR